MAAGGGLIRTEHLMGTVFMIHTLDEPPPSEAVNAAFAWLGQVEATFSTFRADSEISRIGRGELDPDDASPDVRHVLSMCAELEALTEGRFSIRPRRSGGPALDPAGFVKGWSVDEAGLGLQVAGVRQFVIDAGGDVLCRGLPPDGDRWRIGIRDPEDPEHIAARIRIPEGAVATSGTYFRGNHIWGSSTKDAGFRSVTVVGPSLGTADALATAIFGDQARSLSWMSAFPEYGVILLRDDGQLEWTGGLAGVTGGAVGDGAVDV